MTIELTVAELADVTELDLGASPRRRVEQHRVDTFADAWPAAAKTLPPTGGQHGGPGRVGGLLSELDENAVEAALAIKEAGSGRHHRSFIPKIFWSNP